MKPDFPHPAAAVLLSTLLLAATAMGQGIPPMGPPRDPFAGKLFPADLIIRHKDDLTLTDSQRGAMDDAVGMAQARIPELRDRLKEESAKLVELVDKTKIDNEAILAQFDKVAALERELKKTELAAAITLKEQLTPEQQAKLRELRAKEEAMRGPREGDGRRIPPQIAEKAQRVRKGVEKMREEGRDPQPVVEKWREVEELIPAGKPEEAAKKLDDLLRVIEQSDKEG